MSGISDGTTTGWLAGRRAPAGTDQATSALLLCGVVAGPIYVVVGGIQVLTRDGFDLPVTRSVS
jgi:hypothetical protein